ncbi:MAG: hypothetical protein ACKOF9_00540 [Burkholderiales bacterium]
MKPQCPRPLDERDLFQAYAEEALTAGLAARGFEQSFAAALQISPSMWSQIKSARPIGDKLARQIEKLRGQAQGWLDEPRDDKTLSAKERAYLDLALRAWRATDGGGRQALRLALEEVVRSSHPHK